MDLVTLVDLINKAAHLTFEGEYDAAQKVFDKIDEMEEGE